MRSVPLPLCPPEVKGLELLRALFDVPCVGLSTLFRSTRGFTLNFGRAAYSLSPQKKESVCLVSRGNEDNGELKVPISKETFPAYYLIHLDEALLPGCLAQMADFVYRHFSIHQAFASSCQRRTAVVALRVSSLLFFFLHNGNEDPGLKGGATIFVLCVNTA